MKSLLLLIFAKVLVCHAAFPETIQFSGDNCIILHNGSPGVCKSSFQCPAALDLLWKYRIRPTICSFEGLNPIVCCPFNGPPPPPPTPPSTTARPTTPSTRATTPSTRATTPSTRATTVATRPTTQPAGTRPPQVNERKSLTKCRQYKPCEKLSFVSVVGGENTDKDEFPHMTALGWPKLGGGYAWNCGGSLISENFVLTAAHCTEIPRDTTLSNLEPTVARLGDWNLNSDSDGAKVQDLPIVEIIRHPQFSPPSKYHDIALLRLGQAAKFTNGVRPCCLWQSATIPNAYAVATGWGKLGYMDEASEILQKVTLQIIDSNACQAPYRSNRNLKSGIISEQLCAGDPNGAKDTCQGDSGGPLQIPDREYPCSHHLIGITSFGIGCADEGIPAVYSRVSSYLDWIENIVWPN